MSATATQEPKASLIERLLARLETWARGSEIDRMSAEDVRILAQDVGLDTADVVRLAHMESDASRLLYARLAELGLTAEAIEAAGIGTVRDMQRNCAFCSGRSLCEHDLAERPESEDWRRICPNNETFLEFERRTRTAG